MPRANRCFVPGHVWHLTHRCHQQAFLLKFARDRRRWCHWLLEARRRYGLCVLNYIVTCNHIHLLVYDRGCDEIARSMQLIAGRVGQEYNRRRGRAGAFWRDRYHATAVETGTHLIRCLLYIDLNMVRAGVVSEPAAWPDAGFHEIRVPPPRRRIIDRDKLAELCALSRAANLLGAHEQWHSSQLIVECRRRDADWTESVAVGTANYVSLVKRQLNAAGLHRRVRTKTDKAVLRESRPTYAFDARNGLDKPRSRGL